MTSRQQTGSAPHGAKRRDHERQRTDAGDEKVADATKAEESEEASGAAHGRSAADPGRGGRRRRATTLDPDVAAHEREMGRIGADVKGEGEID